MNSLKYIKLFNDEPCPCGSNIKYINCCKNKKTVDAKDSKKPPEIQVMEMMQDSMIKCCLHPEQAQCKGRIKNAHALQNNKIINILAGRERHVYVLDAKRKPLFISMEKNEPAVFVPMSKTSANKATTETCFCDFHDSTIFEVIEKDAPNFDDSCNEMKFIYAYKAFIFEYYKQSIAYHAYQKAFKKNSDTFNNPKMVGFYRMLCLKKQEFELTKEHFDREIIGRTFNGVITCVVRIPEQIKFANFAYIAPDFDLEGIKINHTIDGLMHRLSVTVFPEDTQSYILLSCLDSEKFVYEKLFRQLEEASLDKVKFYISLILPLYSENMVLSPKLWDSWGDDVQAAYTFYANLHNEEAIDFGKNIGMALRNASRNSEYDYNSRGKIDLFN